MQPLHGHEIALHPDATLQEQLEPRLTVGHRGLECFGVGGDGGIRGADEPREALRRPCAEIERPTLIPDAAGPGDGGLTGG
jgi:hypothetical protein